MIQLRKLKLNTEKQGLEGIILTTPENYSYGGGVIVDCGCITLADLLQWGRELSIVGATKA